MRTSNVRGPRFGAHVPPLLISLLLIPVAAVAAESDQNTTHPWLGSDVIVKDLFVQPRIGLHVVNPGLRAHRYHVAHTQGPWLWVTSGETEGWVHQNEVVPVSTAIEFFTAVLHSHPYSGHAYYLRGLVWADHGETDIAIADFTAAIKRDTNNAWAFHGRANAHSEKHEYKKAIADYDEAVRLNALDAAAYNNRGRAHDHLGEYEAALADYSEAIRRDPNLINAHYNRAGAYTETRQDRLAVIDYRRVIHVAPEDAGAHAHLAWVLATSTDASVRNVPEALRAADAAKSLSGGTDPAAWEATAAAQAASDHWVQAAEAQAKAVELLPKGSPERARAESRLTGYREQKPVEP